MQKAKTIKRRDEIIKALIENDGIIKYAAKSCGLNRSTIYKYIEKFPEVANAKNLGRGDYTDFVIKKLKEKIKEGDLQAIFFWLRTQGKDEGFGKSSEKIIKQGPKVNVNFTKAELDKMGLPDLVNDVYKELGSNGPAE